MCCYRSRPVSVVAFKTLTFHKVVSRHTWGVVGSLAIVSLLIFSWFWKWKNFENRLMFNEVKAYKKWYQFYCANFLGPPCRSTCFRSCILRFPYFRRQCIAKRLRCGGICNDYDIAILLSMPVKEFWKLLNIWWSIIKLSKNSITNRGLSHWKNILWLSTGLGNDPSQRKSEISGSYSSAKRGTGSRACAETQEAGVY